MAGTQETDPRKLTAQAEAAFARFLALKKAGEPVDFDAYCEDRPGIAPLLRNLHQSWAGRTDDSGRLDEFLKSRFGSDDDPGIVLDGPPEDGEPAVKQRLKEIAARAPKTERYKLQDEVARGGMGVIFKVWDRDLRRTLAMKVILDKVEPNRLGDTPLVDLQNLSRFLEEAQITGQLDHPGIVPVHELSVDREGRVFFTMRLVRGRTLDEIIRLARAGDDGWNLTRAVGVILKVCEAMAYAHSKRVIHRDLKPSNVMVGRYGETYVMDWGLAKVLGRPDTRDLAILRNAAASLTHVRTDRREDAERTPGSPLLTMDGSVFGTPSYMPPEQAEGRVEALGPRSDVYSVGALLYTLLTGQMPYVAPGSNMSAFTVLNALIGGPPTPVHEIDPTVPLELQAICEKAMARSPDERYADMESMAEDLRAYLENRVVKAYETGAAAEFRKWVKRNKAIAAAVAGVILFAIGVAVFIAWQERSKANQIAAAQAQTEKARALAEENERSALRNQEAALASERLARRQSYVSNLVAADATLRVHEVHEAKRRLAACEEGLRGWEWRHLARRSDTSEAVLRGHAGRITAVAFSPDGTRVASGGEDRAVLVWDVTSRAAVARIEGLPESVTAVAFNPDGSRVAGATRDGAIRIWDASSGAEIASMDGHEGMVTSVAFSPDGQRLLSGSTDETARFWDAALGQPAGVLEGHGAPVQAVAFSPDGARAYTAAEAAIRVWDGATLRPLETMEGHDSAITSLAVSRDGSRVVSGGYDKTVRVWSGGEPLVLEGHGDLVASVGFDGAGRVVSASYDKTVRVWDPDTGQPLALLLGHDEPVRAVAADPRSDRIVSGSMDETLRLWRTGSSGAVTEMHAEEGFLTSLSFGPGGRRLVCGCSGVGAIHVWDPDAGERILSVFGMSGGVGSVAFSADGAWIAAGGEEDSTGRIWDASTGRALRLLRGHEASITAIAFGPRRTRVATGSADQTVRVWDAESGAVLHVLAGHERRVSGVAFDPSGARVASSSFDGTVRLWDAESGSLMRVLEGHEEAVHAVTFDPSGTRIASAGADQTVRLWDAATGTELAVLRGHAGPVHAVAFSPDGARIASGGRDKSVRVWHTESGALLLRLGGHATWVTAVAFGPEGSRLASGGSDGTILVHHAG